jgi:hypothetical protein
MRFRIVFVIVAAPAMLVLGLRDAARTRPQDSAKTIRPSVHIQQGEEISAPESLIPPTSLSIHSPAMDELFPAETIPKYTPGERATFHPHGEQVCASGCAVSRHPTEKLTRERFRRLLAEYAAEPIEVPGRALDTLVYFGRQSAAWLEREESSPLDGLRANLLRSELQLDYAEVSIRLVDETGAVRAFLPPTLVPLDRRHEFELDPHDLPPLIASGTVKRVGRDYVWTRL